ncbi:hypothetical protein LAZ67_X004339 [Cordylochernes scorpioides]|uniref:Uncharacterized protein n=1 Tax=Cordylochernes scorpioides TaxID=51811 RepID=A0ABY6LUV3_9ARAC|nr:hypothetical protein LAZ67_X004339 [Cordylochernes scorpioides]
MLSSSKVLGLPYISFGFKNGPSGHFVQTIESLTRSQKRMCILYQEIMFWKHELTYRMLADRNRQGRLGEGNFYHVLCLTLLDCRLGKNWIPNRLWAQHASTAL